MTDNQLKMGDKVRDTITGFKGKIVARCQYINGCDQCLVKPGVGDDGKMPAGEWIDDQQLEPQAKRRSPKEAGDSDVARYHARRVSGRGGGGVREAPPEIGGSE